MIVVDTNVVVYLLLRGQFTQAAEAARRKDNQWTAPALFRYELLNVLSTYVRTGQLSRDDAIRMYKRGAQLARQVPYVPQPIDLLNLSLDSGIATYDMEFIALATHLGTIMVTQDRQLLNAFPGVVQDLQTFTR